MESKGVEVRKKRGKALKKEQKKKFNWTTVGWVIGLCAWVAICLIGVQFLVSFIMVSILGTAASETIWNAVFSGIVYVLTLLLTILVPWKVLKMKTSREELGLSGLPTWTDILLTPVGFVVYWVVAAIVMALVSVIFVNVDWAQQQNIGFQDLFSIGDKLVAFIALVVVAPIAEEIIFRGWLYGKIRSKVPAWVGILVVSALFGLMHLGFDIQALQWNAAVNIFCMSVVMCVMREITGTIWSTILLHMAKNGIAFYLLYIVGMY